MSELEQNTLSESNSEDSINSSDDDSDLLDEVEEMKIEAEVEAEVEVEVEVEKMPVVVPSSPSSLRTRRTLPSLNSKSPSSSSSSSSSPSSSHSNPKKPAVQFTPAKKPSSEPIRLTAALIGAPGCWKTSMALTAPKPIHILDVDGKFDQLVDTSYYDLADVTYQQFTSSLTGMSKISIAQAPSMKDISVGYDPTIRPRTYEEVIAAINGLYDILDRDGKLPFKTLVLDTISRLAEHMKTFIMYSHKHAVLGQHDWDTLLENYRRLMSGLMGLPCNIIVTSHDRIILDKEKRVISHNPALQGQFAEVFAGYFQEAYYMLPESVNGQMRVQCLTRATREYTVRSSLTELVKVPPDFQKIMRGDFRGEGLKKLLAEQAERKKREEKK